MLPAVYIFFCRTIADYPARLLEQFRQSVKTIYLGNQ